MHNNIEVEQLINEIDETMQTLRAKYDRLRALKRAPVVADPPDRGIKDLIPAAEAAALAHRSKATIARWCITHPCDSPGGFALQLGKRWFVSKSLFLRFLSEYEIQMSA